MKQTQLNPVRFNSSSRRSLPFLQNVKGRPRLYTGTGAGVGILGLGFMLRSDDEETDTRDVTALSRVSFGRLISGWM